MASLWQGIEDRRILLLLGVGALAIYLPGIWWGLPHATSPQVIHGWDVDSVTGMITLAEFHSLFFRAQPDWWVAYPLFHYFVLGLLYAPYLAFLFLTGGLSSPSADYPYGLSDPVGTIAVLTLIGRLVTLGMAVGVVIATYLSAKTIWDKRTAILATVTVMFLGPIFYYSRTGNLDVPVLFWISLAILVLARIIKNGLTVRKGIWLGAFSALAVATKDQAYAALLPGLVLLLLFYCKNSSTSTRYSLKGWGPVIALVLSGALVYVLASGIFLSPQRFLLHLHYIMNFKETFYKVTRPDGQVLYGFGGNVIRDRTLAGYSLLLNDVFASLVEAIGPLALAVALIGIAMTWRSTPFTKFFLVMGLGHLLLLIFTVMHMQYRYSIFLAYILAFFFARAAVMIWQVGPWTRVLSLVVVAISVGWLGFEGLDLTYQMLFDARLQASACLAQSLHPGDQVGYFGGVNQLPALPAGTLPVRLPQDDSALDVLRQNPPQFVLVSPDAWSLPGMDHSYMLAKPVYKALEDGSAGYRKLAFFETRPLLPGNLKYLPIINPTVQVFGSSENQVVKTGQFCK